MCRCNLAIFDSCGTSLLKDKLNLCVSGLTAASGTASTTCGAGMLLSPGASCFRQLAISCASLHVTGLKANPPMRSSVLKGGSLAAGAAEANTGPVSIRSYFPASWA